MEPVGKAVRMVAFSSEVIWSNLRSSGVIGTHQKSSEVIRSHMGMEGSA